MPLDDAHYKDLAAGFLLAFAIPAYSAEAGHYLPGVRNIRDWVVPERGWYFAQYNAGYQSSNLRDANGPAPSPALNTVTLAPQVMWSSGRFAPLIAPTFGSTGIANRLYTINSRQGVGRERWGAGDLFVQPFRVAWGSDRYRIITGYGFYAPAGSYTTGAHDNVGLGFWSHQFTGSGYYYPKSDQSTALMVTTVYEVNTSRRGTTDTPGGHVALEYRISQNVGKWFEAGGAGFDYFQVTDDRGADVVSPTIHEQVHGAGPQGSLWIVPGRLRVTFRFMWEYGAKARFEGTTANLTVSYSLTRPR